MNTYKLTGHDRQDGALGKPDTLKVIVEAESPILAMDKERQARYLAGRNHICFTKVQVSTSKKTWETIPMMEALELE